MPCQGVAHRGKIIEFVRPHARLHRIAEGAVRARLAAHLDRAMAAQGLQSLVAPGLGRRPAPARGCRAAQDDGDVMRLVMNGLYAESASHYPVLLRRQDNETAVRTHHVLVMEVLHSQIRCVDARHLREVWGSFAKVLSEGPFVVMIRNSAD